MSTQKHTILSLTRDELLALMKRTAFSARKYDILYVKWEVAGARARQLRETYSAALSAEMAAFQDAGKPKGRASLKAAQKHLDAHCASEKASRAVKRAEAAEDQLWQELEACGYGEYAAWGDAA